MGDSLCNNLVVESSCLKPCKHTRAWAVPFFHLRANTMGHVFLGLLETRLTGLHAFRLMYFKRALSLASSNKLFSFSVNRDQTIVVVDLFTTKISSLGTSLLQQQSMYKSSFPGIELSTGSLLDSPVLRGRCTLGFFQRWQSYSFPASDDCTNCHSSFGIIC